MQKPILKRTFTDAHRGRAGHINIQHYAQLIGDTSNVLIEASGLSSQQPISAEEERVRFLAELHSGDEVEVYAVIRKLDRDGAQIAGELRRTSDAATVCLFQRNLAPLDTQARQLGAWKNTPSASGSTIEPDISAIDVDFHGSVLNVFPAQVETEDADEHAIMTPRALWHVITEALWATQAKLGADQSALKRMGITGGASVFQLKHNAPITQGASLSVSTSVVGLSNSSLRMMHEVRSADASPEPLLIALYVLTFFDRAQGQRCPLSEVFPGRTFTRN
jgi:acyl-CoA thioesterase FadM